MLQFLCFFAVVARSLSTLRFSFPTLTPAVWLNQSDRLWAPGESLSLHSPLSPQVYALCDKLILASFRKAALSVGQRSAVSSHSSVHTKTKCTGEACMHSQVHAGACKHHNMGRHKYTRWKGGRPVSPKHEDWASHSSPMDCKHTDTHTDTHTINFESGFWKKAPMYKVGALPLIGLLLLSEILN